MYCRCYIYAGIPAYPSWPGLGLPRPKAIVVIPKKTPCQSIYGKKRVKVRSTTGHYATKKRPVKITMYLGLDIIIKLSLQQILIDVQY